MKQADGGCPGLSVVSIHLVVRFSQWMPSCFGYSQKSSWFSLHHFSWRAQKYPCHISKKSSPSSFLYDTWHKPCYGKMQAVCKLATSGGVSFSTTKAPCLSLNLCNYNGLALYMSHVGERWGTREEKRSGGKSMRMKGLCDHFHLYISWQFILIWLAPIPANNFSSDQHHWALRW